MSAQGNRCHDRKLTISNSLVELASLASSTRPVSSGVNPLSLFCWSPPGQPRASSVCRENAGAGGWWENVLWLIAVLLSQASFVYLLCHMVASWKMVKHKPPVFGAAQGVAKVLEDKIGAVKPQPARLAFKRPQLLERKPPTPHTGSGPETHSLCWWTLGLCLVLTELSCSGDWNLFRELCRHYPTEIGEM